MNVLTGRGVVGFKAEGQVVPILPSFPLSRLSATSDTRVFESYVQSAPLSACISDPLQVHTQCLNRISDVGLGESSAETLRTRTWGVVLLSVH